MHRCVLVLAAMLASMWTFEARADSISRSPVSVAAAAGAQATTHPIEPGAAGLPPALIPPLPERKVAAPIPLSWTEQEIADAQARCTQILKNIDAVAVHHPPIKEGREGKCGAAAPIRLLSLGSKPRVTFSPPALVNCKMAAALYKWITGDVQRLAMRHLRERITKIEVMSDYSCRPSYGRRGNRLSEHAFVDALDIRGFTTESGKTARVLDTWGPTKRDIEAQLAAAVKADAVRQAAQNAAADRTAQRNLRDPKSKSEETQAPTAVASKLGTPGSGLVKRTRTDGVEKITVTLPGAPKRKPLEIATRLGGPQAVNRYQDRPAKVAALSPQSLSVPAPGPRSQFLRAAHAAACRIFGTTLGPEANQAHRNHFHVDMAERKYKKICD